MSSSKATEIPVEMPEKMPDLPPSFQETMASSPPVFKTRFACMTFNMFDRIRLINFTEAEVSGIKEVVAARWSPGLAHVQPYGESMEFRLRGRPWSHRSGGNDDSRRLMLRILEKLFDMGWVLQGSMEITLKSESKDSLIFRNKIPYRRPATGSAYLSITAIN
ncbi:hypothetical protein LZL87_011426 [Fusarium oxysporum]|nr:hypothetical protein LZL87_011426 [Fusarium oxysporum]